MMKIGINGFGRIGRAIFRVNESNPLFEITAINDIDPLIKNHAYLLNYDSIYGSLENKVSVSKDNHFLKIDGKRIAFYSKEKIDDIPWENHNTDIVIDSSGIYDNVVNSYNLLNRGIHKVIVTHSPNDSVDHTIIIGANEKTFNSSKHHIISSSICDANACAPILKIINEELCITGGFITTLHPWLSYQNLLDGSLRSVSSPGHYWSDFALGRSSSESLIPKPTTLVPAMRKVLPKITGDIHAMSFRVPTSIVSASDIVLSLKKNTSFETVEKMFRQLENLYPDVVLINNESLVSIDFKGIRQSCVVDVRWLTVIRNKLKLILWYDNEWGYANRVIDIIKLLENS